jgi:hypothetical protein
LAVERVLQLGRPDRLVGRKRRHVAGAGDVDQDAARDHRRDLGGVVAQRPEVAEEALARGLVGGEDVAAAGHVGAALHLILRVERERDLHQLRHAPALEDPHRLVECVGPGA